MAKPPSTERIEVAPEIIEMGHEPQLANTRAVVITAAGIATLVAVAMVVSWTILKVWSEPVDPTGRPPELAAPRLQEPPLDAYQSKALQRLRAEENARLTSYRWLDREESVARVPIARAMQHIAEDGLPAWNSPQQQDNQQ